MLVVAVIEPMTSSARLKLNMKPEQSGFIMPKILLDVVFGEILIALAKSQVSVYTVYAHGRLHRGWAKIVKFMFYLNKVQYKHGTLGKTIIKCRWLQFCACYTH